jgi:hypothetical protein
VHRKPHVTRADDSDNPHLPDPVPSCLETLVARHGGATPIRSRAATDHRESHHRVSANAEAFDLIPTAQLPGVKVLYGGQKDDPVMPLRRALTTSDLAHPTQAVYELIARKIADHLVDRYTVGWFDAETWRTNRPFPNVNP